MSAPALRRRELVRIALGGLWLQAAYNPERRQALGVAAALSPVARLWDQPADRRAFYLRHLENFNTNPAMAGPLLGAAARLEERAAAGDPAALDRSRKLSRVLQSALAGPGDALLWGGVRPAAGLTGAAVAVFAGLWGAAVFLLAYNVLHLGFRLGGIFWGYHRAEEVHLLLRSPLVMNLLKIMPWLLLGGAIASGTAVAGELAAGPRGAGAAAAAAGVILGLRGIARGTLIAWGGMMVGLLLAFTLGSP